ncbi:MAG: 4-alpha-glucanotransferase [Acidimicrobiales bacterium]
MTAPPDRSDPSRWGVARWWVDSRGRRQEVPAATVDAIVESMSAGRPSSPGAASRPSGAGPVVVRLDRPGARLPPGWLVGDDGSECRVGDGGAGRLPPDVAAGYYRLVPDGGQPRPVIVSPGRCPPPGRAPQWGWAAQLYAARSRSSWGIGDLADLAELARWSASLGATMALVSPLHAAAPGVPQEPSPYLPCSRCFPSPLYLRVEDVAGSGEVAEVAAAAAAGRALNETRHIDRDRVWALKVAALEAVFARFEASGGAGLDDFVAGGGAALQGFCTWCALAERYGRPWQGWPESLRRPDGAGVGPFAASGAGRRRIRFFAWLQWHLDRQLAAAAAPLSLVADLAIGVDAGGADSWLWQDSFAPGMRVGAPPDDYNTRGQDWGLPPFDPWRLRAGAYEPFVQTIRGGLRHAGGLRVDHVMGLFRLWWIPEGRPASEGAYVEYPASDLLDIVALEAQRAGAYVVGEDLGTVEDSVRAELAERGVLSYRLLWFEPQRPPLWPVQALGAVTTHDLPTVAGAWTGSDLEAQRALGLAPNEEGSAAMRQRLEQWAGTSAGAGVEVAVERAYALLATAPCAVLSATLEDACGVAERPNMPGTTGEWPNWSLALPRPLEDIEDLPSALAIAAHLERAGGQT